MFELAVMPFFVHQVRVVSTIIVKCEVVAFQGYSRNLQFDLALGQEPVP